MNTTINTPEKPVATLEVGDGDTMILIYIMAMPGWDVSLCMANPVRRCFTLALDRPVVVISNLDGILIQFESCDPQRDLRAARAELAALNYLALAHVGWLSEGQWRCFHGLPDTVSDFSQRLIDAMSQMESQHQIVELYRRALQT